MSDNKELRAPQDASRIALHEDYEVRYWSNKFGVTHEQLKEAVDAVGHSSAAVEAYFKERIFKG